MRILLTGATGFIGSAFRRHALQRGHHVAGLARPESRDPRDLPAHERLTWIAGSLQQTDWPRIASWRPECLVHAAWIAEPGVYLDSPLNPEYARAGAEFVRHAIQSGVGHCVALGTCIEYLPSGESLREDRSPLDPEPRHLYVRAKLDLYCQLETAARQEGWLLAWTRIFYPYGPGEHPERLCSQIARRLRAGREVILKTPGSVKDFIHIEDVATALLRVCETRASGSFNVGTGVGNSVRRMATILGELTGRPQLIREEPTAFDPFPHVVADASRLAALGWKPQISLEVGLQRLLAATTPGP